MANQRIIGEDWATRYPEKFAGRAAEPHHVGLPCPVCGHPTGDCAPHDLEPMMTTAPAKKATKKAAAKPQNGDADPITGIPIGPDGTVAPGYEPVETDDDTESGGGVGAVNEHGLLAGGQHQASRVVGGQDPTPATGPDSGADLEDAPDLARMTRKGFTKVDGNPQVMTATKNVYATYVPAGAVRSSTTRLFTKGITYAKTAVAAKLDRFSHRPDTKLTYDED